MHFYGAHGHNQHLDRHTPIHRQTTERDVYRSSDKTAETQAGRVDDVAAVVALLPLMRDRQTGRQTDRQTGRKHP